MAERRMTQCLVPSDGWSSTALRIALAKAPTAGAGKRSPDPHRRQEEWVFAVGIIYVLEK
jgi:hypothetical protein